MSATARQHSPVLGTPAEREHLPELVHELEFDAAGDIVRATGTRPFAVGKTFVPTPWGGDFSDYASFNGTRVPTCGQAWWELPEGRFVYWRGRINALELIDEEV